jgi:hypothetical protein
LETVFTLASTLVTAALVADSSFDVTLAAPATTAEIRLERAFKMDCNPWVETLPTDRADNPLSKLLMALAMEAALLAALDAAFATDKALDAAVLTTLAAFDAALATDRAFEAAVETMLAALLAALATDKALDAALPLMASPVARDAASTLIAVQAADILSLRTLMTD